MRVADKVLIVATLLATAWPMVVVLRYSTELGRFITHELRETLQRAHTEEESGRVADDYARSTDEAIRYLSLITAAPALAVSGLWCVLAVVRRERGVIP